MSTVDSPATSRLAISAPVVPDRQGMEQEQPGWPVPGERYTPTPWRRLARFVLALAAVQVRSDNEAMRAHQAERRLWAQS